MQPGYNQTHTLENRSTISSHVNQTGKVNDPSLSNTVSCKRLHIIVMESYVIKYYKNSIFIHSFIHSFMEQQRQRWSCTPYNLQCFRTYCNPNIEPPTQWPPAKLIMRIKCPHRLTCIYYRTSQIL